MADTNAYSGVVLEPCSLTLHAGVSTKIVGVGASITLGMGAADGHSWMVWLEKYTRAYVGEGLPSECRLSGGARPLITIGLDTSQYPTGIPSQCFVPMLAMY
jgi:hypothetical protein